MSFDTENPSINGVGFNLDIVLQSDLPIDSSLLKSFNNMGLSIYSDHKIITRAKSPVGSINLLTSPKRVSGCMSISITDGRFIESKHSLSDFIIKHDDHLEENLVKIIHTYALDFIKNLACKEKVREGLTKVVKKVNPNELNDTLLSRIIIKYLDEYLTNYSTPNIQDLKHQAAFFLSTVEPSDLFKNFHEFSIQPAGDFVGNRPVVNKEVVREAVDSQEKVVERFIHETPDDVKYLLELRKPFSKDSTILKRNNGIYFSNNLDLIPVELREVPLDYAYSVHENLHYIHAARGEMAFGLFLDGYDIPFSVLTVDKIDRNYKKEAILMSGLNPSTCLEFSRLFSRPDCPMNTSSFMLSSVKDILKKRYPSTQAIMTSFMPAYASGKSMICSKFDTCLFSKELWHEFYEVDDLIMHRVRRRKQSNCIRENKFPLSPTLYLICKLRNPSNNFWRLPTEYMPYYSKNDIEEI